MPKHHLSFSNWSSDKYEDFGPRDSEIDQLPWYRWYPNYGSLSEICWNVYKDKFNRAIYFREVKQDGSGLGEILYFNE